MEILLVCAYSIFVTNDLIDSWKVLISRKKGVFLRTGLFTTILLFVYIGFEIFPTLPDSNLRMSFQGWYGLGYNLLTAYSVYDFVIWIIMSFLKVKEDNQTTKRIEYGFRHVGLLIIGTCAICYLTILGEYYLFPPVGVSLIDVFWIAIYFVCFIIAMIRMVRGGAMDFKSIVRIVFSSVMGIQLLFFIMFTVDRLVRLG